jgi:hypothetical protein
LQDLAQVADEVDETWKNIFRAKKALAASHYDAARTLLEKVLQAEPKNVTALNLEGMTLSRLAAALGNRRTRRICCSRPWRALPEWWICAQRLAVPITTGCAIHGCSKEMPPLTT